ncbi:MAG: MFS transporter, partial [Saprospiraceae bacterium]|nr:MFS transporter [Saprospiraceae bacterium]
LYTVFTNKEYPPFDISDYQKAKEVKKGFGAGFAEIIDAIANMPAKMRQISLVQFFTWPGLFLMWFYFGVATTRSVFKYDDTLESYDKLYDKIKTDPTAKNLTFDQLMAYAGANQAAINIDAGSFKDKFGESSQSFMDNMKLNRERKTAGNNWGGICFAFYSLVTFLFSFILPSIANRLGKRNTHALCLAIGAFSLISVRYIDNQYMLLAAMMGVGIAWTSILSMPYAMLAGSIPAHRTGIYMGIFNFFIVLPEIIAALFFGWIMANILDNDRLAAVQLGGFVLLFASLLCFQIREIEKVHASV